MTQQALSRQIKELEDDLGVQLFERTTRKVTLTPAGQTLYEGAASVVGQFDEAVAVVRRTDRALSGRLRLGFCPGAALELTSPILRAYQESFPDVEIDMREFPLSDPSAGLASGLVDVAIIRLPQSTPRLEIEELFVDPVVAMVSEHHRLAARPSVSVQDLLEETLTVSNTTDEEDRAFWGLRDARLSDDPARLISVGSVTEEAALVVAGVAVSITSSAFAVFAPMPGVCHLVIDDWPGSTVAVAWRAGERTRVTSHFVDSACSVRDAQTELIKQMTQRRPKGCSGRQA